MASFSGLRAALERSWWCTRKSIAFLAGALRGALRFHEGGDGVDAREVLGNELLVVDGNSVILLEIGDELEHSHGVEDSLLQQPARILEALRFRDGKFCQDELPKLLAFPFQ